MHCMQVTSTTAHGGVRRSCASRLGTSAMLPTLRSGAAARHQPSVSYRCSIEMKAKYGIRATVSSTQNLTSPANAYDQQM